MICQFKSMCLIEETLKEDGTPGGLFFDAKIKNSVHFNGRGEKAILPLLLSIIIYSFVC